MFKFSLDHFVTFYVYMYVYFMLSLLQIEYIVF